MHAISGLLVLLYQIPEAEFIQKGGLFSSHFEGQEHGAGIYLAPMVVFWLHHNMAVDIMVKAHERRRDHMVRQGPRETQGSRSLVL
jgi:hypothetical protein